MVNNQPLSASEEGRGRWWRGRGGEVERPLGDVVGVGCGGADGRVWSLSNDGEVSPHPSVGVGGEVVGVRRVAAGRCGGCGVWRMCGGRRGTGRHPRRLMVLVACVHDLCDALIHEEAASACYLKGGISGTIKGA